MAYGNYVVWAGTEGLAKLSEAIRAAVGTGAGDPVVPVSATRAVIAPAVADALAMSHPSRDLATALAAMGAARAEAITPEEVVALLSWREPGELGMDRTLGNGALVVDGYDWHLRRSRLVEAWQIFGGPGRIDWGDVVVGQIDTGYTEHPCLGWRDGRSPVVDTTRDRNFYYRELRSEELDDRWANHDPNSAEDPGTGAHGGHGTRTGGLLAGYDTSAAAQDTGNGNPPATHGYLGGAPLVPYVPIRISDSVWINNATDGLADALEYLVDEVGAPVITLSMGAALPAFLPAKARDMIDRAYARGTIFCCAAGNVIPSVVAPARSPRTIGVGGSTPEDRPWSGSSYGRYVDISAPAWPIRRASTTWTGKFVYGYGDGTSFATPQVAATAALWLVRHRAALPGKYPEPWMRAAAFLKVLTETARRPQQGWDTTRYGAGLLDARAVMDVPLPAAATLVYDREPH